MQVFAESSPDAGELEVGREGHIHSVYAEV